MVTEDEIREDGELAGEVQRHLGRMPTANLVPGLAGALATARVNGS